MGCVACVPGLGCPNMHPARRTHLGSANDRVGRPSVRILTAVPGSLLARMVGLGVATGVLRQDAPGRW